MKSSKWVRIALFYVIALAVSAVARPILHIGDLAASMQNPWIAYLHLVGGAGPALGALIVALLFGYRSRITLRGTSLKFGLAMVAVPAIILAAVGLPNPFGIDAHVFGLHMGVMIAFYAILEELGWRGYLQDEFADTPALLRYAVVGTFWYAWHFTWLAQPVIETQLIILGFMIAASIGIGFAADRTSSVLAAAAFHIVGNIMGLTTDFERLIPVLQTRAMIALACVVCFIILMRVWRIRQNRAGLVAS